MTGLRVDDNDKGAVTVTLNGSVLKRFGYGAFRGEDNRREAMLKAQWYREGYGDALDGPADDDGPSDADLPTAADLEDRDRSYRQSMIDVRRGHLLR